MPVEKSQDDGIDRGEIRTEFVRSHADIKANGKTMCRVHTWEKLSENEIFCKVCPTALIVGIDDERLVNFDKKC